MEMQFRAFTALALFSLFGCSNAMNTLDGKGERTLQEEFFEDVNIKSRVWYLNGEIDSVCQWYYEGGQLKMTAQFHKGQPVGHAYHYFPDGKSKAYMFFDDSGNLVYRRNFSEQGEIKAEEGIPVYIVFDEYSAIVKKDSLFSFFVHAALPPYSIVAILTSKQEQGKKAEPPSKYELADKVPYFRFSFDTVGIHRVYVVAELNDTIRQSLRRDTVAFEVSVVDK